jgi:hypothetical protein
MYEQYHLFAEKSTQRPVPRACIPGVSKTRAGLHRLNYRKGPRCEALRASLSCFPVLPLTRLWDWVYAKEEMLWRAEEAHFERKWVVLGLGWTRRSPGPDANAASLVGRAGVGCAC